MNMGSKLFRIKKGFNVVLNQVKIISIQNGLLKAEFKVTEDCVDEYNNVHNGFSAAAVDVLTSVGLQSTFKSDIINFVSVDMHFSFLEPARLGDEILIETKVIKKGKSMCFLGAEMRNKFTNDLVLQGGQIVYLLNK